MVEHSEILLVVASVADLKIAKGLTQYHPLHFTFFLPVVKKKVAEFPRHFFVFEY